MKFELRKSNSNVIFSARGWSALAMLVSLLSLPYLFSLQYSLTERRAEESIRHYYRYQASQRYAAVYKDGHIDERVSKEYLSELARIDGLTFQSIEIGRLLPDYLFSVRPSYYAKAVIRDADNATTTRYFYFGKDQLVLGESSRFVWLFVV